MSTIRLAAIRAGRGWFQGDARIVFHVMPRFDR